MPGDFEHRTRVKRLAEGFDIPHTIMESLRDCADRLNVSMSEDTVEPADEDRYRV